MPNRPGLTPYGSAVLAAALLPALLLGCNRNNADGFGDADAGDDFAAGPGEVERPFGTAAPAPGAFDGFEEDLAPAGSTTAAPPPEVTFTTAPPPAAAGASHTLRKGDTLWSLARRYYGDPRRWVDIRDANPGINPNRLRVGTTLIIP